MNVKAYPQKDVTDERMFFMGFRIYAETKDKFVMRKQLKENTDIVRFSGIDVKKKLERITFR